MEILEMEKAAYVYNKLMEKQALLGPVGPFVSTGLKFLGSKLKGVSSKVVARGTGTVAKGTEKVQKVMQALQNKLTSATQKMQYKMNPNTYAMKGNVAKGTENITAAQAQTGMVKWQPSSSTTKAQQTFDNMNKGTSLSGPISSGAKARFGTGATSSGTGHTQGKSTDFSEKARKYYNKGKGFIQKYPVQTVAGTGALAYYAGKD